MANFDALVSSLWVRVIDREPPADKFLDAIIISITSISSK
jgi:hypothetical protein